MAYGRAMENSVLIEDHFSFPQSMPEKSILTTSTPFKLSNLIIKDNEFAWKGSLESLKLFVQSDLIVRSIGSVYMHQAYKKARNDVAKKVKNAKAKHFIHCFEKTTNNPQEMWKTINKLINKKSKTTTISEIKTENGSFTDPKKITNVLNEYFCNIGYNLAQNLEKYISSTLELCRSA